MHTGTGRKGFVTSVTRSPPVRIYTGCTLVHEYIEDITARLFIYLFVCRAEAHVANSQQHSGNVMMFTIINDDNVTLIKQART